jgi:hypothetical protein
MLTDKSRESMVMLLGHGWHLAHGSDRRDDRRGHVREHVDGVLRHVRATTVRCRTVFGDMVRPTTGIA